ncbi:MAG: FecR domain-containing protein [Bacteroidota bacterium]
MQANEEEINLISTWLEDESFQAWARRSSREEKDKWEHYFVLHPEYRPIAEIARGIYLGIEFKEIQVDQKQQARVYADLVRKIEHKKAAKRVRMNRRWRSMAAAIAVLMVVSSVLYFQFWHNRVIIIATNYGETLEKILPDSSLVTLNANSELKFYRNHPRKVYLDGEGFFEVRKKLITKEQFQVVTNDLKVNVLGTNFNVNSRQERTKVFLEEGIVHLEIANEEQQDTIIKMSPGDLITYSKKEQSLSNESKENQIVSSWKDGTMEFKEALLTQILKSMKDIYGVDIYLMNEQLANRSITIALPNGNLKVALETLEDILGMKVERAEENTYLLGK